jgi:hypothetical protein
MRILTLFMTVKIALVNFFSSDDHIRCFGILPFKTVGYCTQSIVTLGALAHIQLIRSPVFIGGFKSPP